MSEFKDMHVVFTVPLWAVVVVLVLATWVLVHCITN